MKTRYRTEGQQVYFGVIDVEPAYLQVVQAWATDEPVTGQPIQGGWEKAFSNQSLHIQASYQHFAQHADAFFAQLAGLQPFLWEQALEALLQRLTGTTLDWWLAGSTALAARGIQIAPHDLDIVTDDAGALVLGELLEDCLVEPLQDSRGWISNWFGRAFLYGRVEWVGGIDPQVDEPETVDFGPLATNRLETITWRGYQVRVPPLDLQLQVSARRGLDERVEKTRQFMDRYPG